MGEPNPVRTQHLATMHRAPHASKTHTVLVDPNGINGDRSYVNPQNHITSTSVTSPITILSPHQFALLNPVS